MGCYYRVYNSTKHEAFEGVDSAVKRLATAYWCGPELVLLLAAGHWAPGDCVGVVGDDIDIDLYAETQRWPEPKALGAIRAEYRAVPGL